MNIHDEFKPYNAYLVKDMELFQIVLDKIQAAKQGELIPLTREEHHAWVQAIQIKKTVPTIKAEAITKCPRCKSDLEIINFPFEGDLRCPKCKRTFRPERYNIHYKEQEEQAD